MILLDAELFAGCLLGTAVLAGLACLGFKIFRIWHSRRKP